MPGAHSYRVSNATLTPQQLWARTQSYIMWRAELNSRGIDPDWIGVTEVEPVLCPHCDKQLPWALLKRGA